MLLFTLVGALWGCGGDAGDRSAADPGNPPDDAVDAGWIAVIADRDRFDTQMKTDGRQAWIALHAGRLADAWSTMETPAGRARAASELSDLYTEISVLHRDAAVRLASEWADAPDPVKQAGLAASDCTRRPEAPLLAERFDAQLPTPPSDAHSSPLWTPVWTIEEADFTRVIHDPCTAHRISQAWAPDARPEGLPASLFGAIPMEPGDARSAEGARQDLRALDAALDAIRERYPDDDGVFEGLAVFEIARIRTAIALAGHALDDIREEDSVEAIADTYEYARTLLQLAHPPDRPAIGPTTPPLLYARLARAELGSGRPRQALDWLAPLGDRAAGARETVSDLAVLRSLSHVGDSKEAP